MLLMRNVRLALASFYKQQVVRIPPGKTFSATPGNDVSFHAAVSGGNYSENCDFSKKEFKILSPSVHRRPILGNHASHGHVAERLQADQVQMGVVSGAVHFGASGICVCATRAGA